MDTLYIVLILLGCGIFGYLFGSISSGIIISKILFQKDPRDYGSHNSGGTNVGRTFGLKVGLITIFFDILKTIIPVWTVYFILKYSPLSSFNLSEYGYLITSLTCLIGHCYPIYHQFKGGKAVSSFGGVLIATSWSLTLFGFIVFLSVLFSSKKVSLSSITASVSSGLVSFLLMLLPNWMMNFGMQGSYLYSITIILCAGLLVFRHRANIVRLINHTESEVKFIDKLKNRQK